MPNTRTDRNPALERLLPFASRLETDASNAELKARPSGLSLPKREELDDSRRLGHACATVLAAEAAFQDTASPWDDAHDATLMEALDTLDQLAPAAYADAAPAIMSQWSATILFRVTQEIDAFSDQAGMEPISRLMQGVTRPTFAQLWLSTLRGLSKAVNGLLRLRDDAGAHGRRGILTTVVPKHAGQLLELIETGGSACPSFARILMGWPPSTHVELDAHTADLFACYRWDIVRWAILLAHDSDNGASLLRWGRILQEGLRTHPREARGAGPATIISLADAGALHPVSPADVRRAQSRTEDLFRED